MVAFDFRMHLEENVCDIIMGNELDVGNICLRSDYVNGVMDRCWASNRIKLAYD